MCCITKQGKYSISTLQKRTHTFIVVTVAYTTTTALLGSVQYPWCIQSKGTQKGLPTTK